MRFSIGYQLPDEDDSTPALVRDFHEHVAEVYFALPGEASGRSALETDDDAHRDFERDLEALAGMGVGLVLLVNAACYGEKAVSQDLAERICRAVGNLTDRFGLAAVTTTSPFVARVLKGALPGLEVRASVNMRIGTVKAMAYLADAFDAFYLEREYNRDLGRIAQLAAWCEAHGKRLDLLANSGCMAHCPWQTFHDNLVAHEADLARQANVPARWPSPCWEYLAKRENWPAILQNTWIRPEDLHHYARWFPVAKLATRMHARPRLVLAAYAAGRFHGNLLDLMEPGYGPLLAPWVLDNSRFPAEWFERTMACSKACHACDYCRQVLETVLIRAGVENGV